MSELGSLVVFMVVMVELLIGGDGPGIRRR
jgi:hypothetical protein